MSDVSDLSEEERSLFRPFTRESLAAIEARIAEEYAKQKELEKKRVEGEVTLETFYPDIALHRGYLHSTVSFMQSHIIIEFFQNILHN